MSEPKRCYKCGRVQCETCGGDGVAEDDEYDIEVTRLCPDCKGTGWREAEECDICEGMGREFPYMGGDGFDDIQDNLCFACKGSGDKRGTDPAILCPNCQEDE